MKYVFRIFVCLIAISSQAQTFKELIKQGDELYDNNEFSESAKVYQNAFQIKEGNASQYYNAACSFALSNDTIQSINYLNVSADKGWQSLNHIKRDKDLINLHSVKGWQDILTKVQANLERYQKDFDMGLKAQLERIYVQDQTLRQLYKDAQNKFGKNSEEMGYFWKLMSQQDSINEDEVIKIINERGWVGKSVVGGKANITLWLVIQHAPIEKQEKYLPFLQESVKQGESMGRHLALLEDRILMRNNKPQKYGSQIVTNDQTGKDMVYDIEEPQYVNQRRKEVGLGSIEDYLEGYDIEWTIEQKEK